MDEYFDLLKSFDVKNKVKLNVIIGVAESMRHKAAEIGELIKRAKKVNQSLDVVVGRLIYIDAYREIFSDEAALSEANVEGDKVKEDDPPLRKRARFHGPCDSPSKSPKKDGQESADVSHADALPKGNQRAKLDPQKKKPQEKDLDIIRVVGPELYPILFTNSQCKVCGLRFDHTEAEMMSVHLQDHHRRIRAHDSQLTISREYMCRVSAWSSNKLSLPNIKVSVPKIRCDKAQCCKICGKKIPVVWCDDDEFWMLENAVRVGPNYCHRKCVE